METPPGLNAKPTVTVRISGATEEEIIIVGKVVPDVSLLAQNQPLSISSPAPSEPESTASVCEAIDCVDVDSDAILDPDDMPYKLNKVDSDDTPFPKSFGSDMIKRSKARRKKMKNIFLVQKKCSCDDDDCTKIAVKTELDDPNDIVVDLMENAVSDSKRPRPTLSVGHSTPCTHVSHVKHRQAVLSRDNLEQECWNLITPKRSSMPSTSFSWAVGQIGDDFEIIDDGDPIIIETHPGDNRPMLYCDETFDESFDNINECSFASKEDLFEIFVNNFVQDRIEQDDAHRELFTEEEIGEDEGDVPAIHAEEEEKPPMNFESLMAFADGVEVEADADLSLAQKLSKKIMNMVRIRKGLTVDSGAADHVMPIGWLVMFIVMASLGSKRGLHYVAADGTRIPNLGQQLVRFMTLDGTWCEVMFQVAGIHKPLVSVSKLIEAGYRVVFDTDNSYIIHKKTKQIIKMRKERGVFVVDAYVTKTRTSQGFTRPR